MVRNATLDEIKENGWLKRKACENCVKKLKETLSEEQMQQFKEAFYMASEKYLFRESVTGQK